MANYFIRPDGNDSNTGLGPTSGQAWLTLGKALGSTGIKSGDVLYVSPGKHTASFSTAISPNPTVNTRIVGDSNSTFFTDIAPGEVRFNHYTVNDNTAGLTGGMVYIANDYLSFENIVFAGYGNANNTYLIYNQSGWKNITFYRCKFYQSSRSLNVRSTLTWEGFLSNALINLTVDSCIFYGTGINITTPAATSNTLDNTNIVNNIFINPLSTGQSISITSPGSTGFVIGQKIANNHFIACSIAISISTNPLTTSTLDTTFCYKIINNLFTLCGTNISAVGGNRSYTFTELQNRYVGGARTGSSLFQSNICTDGYPDIDFLNSLQLGYDSLCPLTPVRGGVNVATGSSTGSSTDYFGATWVTNPSIGPLQLNSVNGLTNYVPIQQSPSSITIAPGSTSQSIELFLGAKGLTASTSGLSARYNRTRTASVSIPLVARTIAQAWTAGGFAEVDATNMPGVYRLDLPDAALAAGADDVTVVVRGASGTNGAVMTVKLSSGGLTSAQTASAVLDAVGSSYVTAGSIGYAIQNSNVASISGSTAAADELEGALLHNGTDYISAELVTPVTSAALVRMGPYEVKADGLGASDPLDIQKGAQHGVDIQCVDGNGNGIDITSATVTAKVYNSGGSLVDTYSCTATYAADGRATFTIDTTVTNTPGTYTATITRTTGASDTQVFGPLRIYVRDI